MPRTVGSSGPETRGRILDAAAELFAEQGYAGATMLEIAQRLGISKSALYYHFASKEELVYGLVHPVFESLAEFARAAENGERSVEQILRGYLDHMIGNAAGHFPFIADPGVREVVKARYDPRGLMRRVEAALANLVGGPDSAVRAQFALGGFRSVLMSRMTATASGPFRSPGAGGVVLLTGEEREAVLRAALAALGMAERSDSPHESAGEPVDHP